MRKGVKRRACDMEPQERMVGRNLSVPREYFGAEAKPAKKAKKGKGADAPYVALVLKPVVIENQFYHGAGVEVRLARAVHNRDVWWLPLPHAAEFVSNDETCAVCGDTDDHSDGCGAMLMCDGCPQSFHLGCVGLDTVPDVDAWFCDGQGCGGPALQRQHPQEEEEEEEVEAAPQAKAKAKPQTKKQEAAAATAVDPAVAAAHLFKQQLAQAVRKVQAEHGMAHRRFWALVAKEVPAAEDATQCATAWFRQMPSPGQAKPKTRAKHLEKTCQN